MRVNITYRDVPLTVECDYTPGTPDTWEEPGEPEDIEIDCVLHAGDDIGALLSKDAREEIESLAMKAAAKQLREDMDEARAEQRIAMSDCFADAGRAAFGGAR